MGHSVRALFRAETAGHLQLGHSAPALLKYLLNQSTYTYPLHLEIGFVMCVGADENQAHRCDPYGLRVQEQPLFLVCSSITIFTSVGLGP